MPDTPVTIERLLDAPIEKVWKAISTKEEMDKWYFDIASFTATPGFNFQFTGQGSGGEKYVHLCEVKEVIPMKKLSYSWRYEGMPGDSLVTFELTPEGDKTKLLLTHTGIESFGAPTPDFAKESFMKGWTHIIGTSLTDFVNREA